jgi:hypothetical protein
MAKKEAARCSRCGKRLRKGGDNYRLQCAIVSDFDGYLDMTVINKDWQEITRDITQSGLSEEELAEQVYFKLNQLLCFDCRNFVIDFLKGKD